MKISSIYSAGKPCSSGVLLPHKAFRGDPIIISKSEKLSGITSINPIHSDFEVQEACSCSHRILLCFEPGQKETPRQLFQMVKSPYFSYHKRSWSKKKLELSSEIDIIKFPLKFTGAFPMMLMRTGSRPQASR